MRNLGLPLALLASLGLCSCGGSGSTGTGAQPSASTTRVTTVTRTAPGSATPTGSTGTGSVTSGGSGGSPVAGPPPCRAANLAVAFLGQQGATGHGELGFALRDAGSSSCSTIGYPGVQFLSRSGADLPTAPTHVTRDFFGSSPVRELVLNPGRSVSFRLGVTHGAGSSAGCTTAYGLQVIAPNDTATMRVSIPGGAEECGTVTVSPVRTGVSAYP